MLIIKDARVAERLQALATQQGKTVEDIIRGWLDETEISSEQHGIDSQTLLAIVKQFAFRGKFPVDAEYADDILETEFTDELLARMNDDTTTTPGR